MTTGGRISTQCAARRAAAARARGATIAEAIEVAIGRRDWGRYRRAQRGARKAADAAARRTPYTTSPKSLERRLRDRLAARYTAEVERRGGETGIEERSRTIPLDVVSRVGSLVLLRAEGYRHYSRRYGAEHAALAYLCGMDDSGPWAVRVPSTMRRIRDAVSWIEPARVSAARAAGRRVLRQGDVYAVETTRDRAAQDAATLPRSHCWDAETRTLHHEPDDGRRHAPLEVPFPARLLRQHVYQMGRGARRRGGD